jgi:Ni,Fe-hydrogenase III large subunit
MINSIHELKDILGEKFDLGLKNVQATSDNELIVSGRDDKMLDVLGFLASACDARLVSQVTSDLGSHLELVDVLFLNHLHARVHVKIEIDAREKKVTSIAGIFLPAKWLEKYQSTFLAVDFQPRAKQAQDPAGAPASVAGQDSLASSTDVAGNPWINIHADDIVDKTRLPAGPGLFDSKLDLLSYTWVRTKQTIATAMRGQLGHYHRGMMAFAEATPLDELPPIIARACWRDKWHALVAFSNAVERAAGIEEKVPLHASYWRIFGCELERIKNHHEFLISCLLLAGHTELANQNRAILRFLDPLEKLLFDDATKTPFIVPGGITHDPVATGRLTRPAINDALRKHERGFMKHMFGPINDQGLFDEFEGVGSIPKTIAMRAGLNGPTLRASGLPYDVRADFPQGPYKQGLLRWDICTSIDGDVRARIEIHAHEIVQSLRIMYQLNAMLAETPVSEASRLQVIAIPADAEGFAVVESARGEFHAYVRGSKETGKLGTIRLQAPSYNNFTALEHAMGIVNLRKLPYIIHSINPCWACIDQ